MRRTNDVCAQCWSTIPPGIEITWSDKRFDTHSCRARFIEYSLLIEEKEGEKNGHVVPFMWPTD